MYGIKVLEEEHDNILRFTTFIRGAIAKVLEGDRSILKDVPAMIDFVRNYADAHHHGKEELILFNYMLEDLGPVAEKVVRQGMLVEHDQARHIISSLEEHYVAYEQDPTTAKLVDVVGLLYNYAFLLEAHATRENTVVYPFAEKNLSESRLKTVDEETKAFEENHRERREHYLGELQRFEKTLKA